MRERQQLDKSGAHVQRLRRRITALQHALRQEHRRGVAAARDAAERLRAEEALRESEARYRALVHSQVDLVSRYLPDTNLTFVNDAYCRFFGRTREELIGHTFMFMVAPEFREMVAKETLESAREARTTVGEYLNFTQDGRPVWIQWIISGIADDSGRVVEFQAVGRDITPLKTAEEALRQANLVVENSPAVLFRWQARAGWPVAYVSQNVVQFGYTPSELLSSGAPYVDLVHPEDLARFEDEIRHYSTSEVDRFQREYRILTRDGEVRWVDERTAVERDEQGQLTHYQGIVIDVTERKKAELESKSLQNQLQQAMKMEAVGRLAGGVAHDFNNLLTAIVGNVDLIGLDLDPGDPRWEFVEEANKAARSAAALIRQLLAFSRRQVIEPRVLNLNELIGGLRTMLARVIGEHIVVEYNLSSGLGSVRLDPGQFEQVLVNLAVNARDAMPDGGRLLVETSNVELGGDYVCRHPYATEGTFVRLKMSDSGHGMSDEVKQHLFEPFFTTKPVGRGTGLGLATTFGIVRQAGGSIEVYSELGQGTTFGIYLPRVSESATEPEAAGPPVRLPRGGEAIMLVEDDAGVRNLAATSLKHLGYSVLAAANGSEALELSKEFHGSIDLLLTDVVMPGMNGHELAQRLLETCPLMRVLYCSGYAEDVIVHNGVVDEQVNFIGKPYSIQTLANKVRGVLDGH
jgi:two-component system cell cycle sensor histidine kinase/response regulator CckA